MRTKRSVITTEIVSGAIASREDALLDTTAQNNVFATQNHLVCVRHTHTST